MTDTNTQDWYYGEAGAQRGPVPLTTLRAMADNGTLRPEALVWTNGMTDWTPAGRVAALFDGRVAVPPPMPPVASYASNYVAAPPLGESAGVRMLIPVGRSGWAIAAGYLGLFAVLLIFAPVALVIGIIALRDIKKHPELHGAGRAWFGVIMGALFSIALILMIVAVAAGR